MKFTQAQGKAIIERLGMQPIPIEGGLFAQTWRLEEDDRVIGTAIYGALTDDPDSFSAMHRLTEVEIWHFYGGDPIQLVLLHDDGSVDRPVLGSDLLNGEFPQVIVPLGTWMGGALVPGGVFALFGTTMAPGFTDRSFEAGVRHELQERWPSATADIERLTRPGSPRHLPGVTP